LAAGIWHTSVEMAPSQYSMLPFVLYAIATLPRRIKQYILETLKIILRERNK